MESKNNTDVLRESVFFTARKARLSITQESSGNSATSSDLTLPSSQYYSARIHSVVERLGEWDVNEVDVEIEASKDHWTEVDPDYPTEATSVAKHSSSSESRSVSSSGGTTQVELALFEENLEVIRDLRRQNPCSDFFQDEGEWVLGRKIGEGGQAEIYEADQFIRPNGEKITLSPRALKVFKVGYSLLDLQKQWPIALLHKLHPSILKDTPHETRPHFCHEIWSGSLLKDGRFAFEMPLHWGDLRKFMDVRMQQNGNQRPPFMKSNGNYHECCMLKMMWQIATGMRSLHMAGALHRDLKASNSLIDFGPKLDDSKFESSELDHSWTDCDVADFECSIGIVGTKYWRAPEILEAVRNCTLSATSNLFTPKSDVYSYAMTCYEILTGYIPFEDIEDNGRTSYEDVIKGKRPKLPRHLRPWIKELLNNCWNMDPSKRPTFQEIVDVLTGVKDNDPSCQNESDFFKFHCLKNSMFKIEKKKIDSNHIVTTWH